MGRLGDADIFFAQESTTGAILGIWHSLYWVKLTVLPKFFRTEIERVSKKIENVTNKNCYRIIEYTQVTQLQGWARN